LGPAPIAATLVLGAKLREEIPPARIDCFGLFQPACVKLFDERSVGGRENEVASRISFDARKRRDCPVISVS